MDTTMDQETFHHLFGLAAKGDEAAAEYLFRKCFDDLRPFAASLVGPVLAAARIEPEDIIQETYAAAWPGMSGATFAGFASFLAWLRTIAENKAIDMRRAFTSDKRDVGRQVDPEATWSMSCGKLGVDAASPDRSPSSHAAQNENVAILTSRIWRLPPEYREVIRSRFIHNVPVAEVANRLGKTESAVYMLTTRALKKLRDLMGSPSKYLSST